MPTEAPGSSGRKPRRGRIESPFKELREHFGYTREQLAEEVGVSFSTLRAWEQGLFKPMPEGRRRLKNVFIGLAMKEGLDRKRAALWVMERLVPIPRKAIYGEKD